LEPRVPGIECSLTLDAAPLFFVASFFAELYYMTQAAVAPPTFVVIAM
jgi:hypothetical protein